MALWILGAFLTILATRKQIVANPGRRIALFYGKEHADPAQTRWLRTGGATTLMLSTMLFIHLWGMAALISLAMGFVPGTVVTLHHNHSLRSQVA